MKQYVVGTAIAVTLLFATACTSQTPAPKAVVTGPHSTPAHEIPTINTDRGNETDAAKVNYVTGGIGDDERAAIEAEKATYNVHITSASVKGAFVEDTTIVIKDKTGAELLNVSAGPLLYVQLPAGSYTIVGTHADETKTIKLTIGKKTKTANPHFGWKVAATTSDE